MNKKTGICMVSCYPEVIRGTALELEYSPNGKGGTFDRCIVDHPLLLYISVNCLILQIDDMSEAQLIAELRDVARQLSESVDPFDDGWRALERARGIALRIARFHEECLLPASTLPSDHFLLVSHVFRRLVNDTWKLFTGDSAVQIGHGIETMADFRQSLLGFLQQLGMLVQQTLNSEDSVALGDVMDTYKESLAAYYRMARACEVYLAGEPLSNT